MKIFKTFRINAMGDKRLGRYLLYAIGEIILVVIGILIAVNINNYNESKNSQRQLQSILHIYDQDLKIDTTVIGRKILLLKEKQKLFNVLLSDTVRAQDYLENPTGFGLAMTYSPFEFQTKGYQMLQNHADERSTATDTLIITILAGHKEFKKLIDVTQQRISDDISDNILYMKNNQPWLDDLFKGNYENPVLINYFLSGDYRSRLALHNVLANGNLLVILQEHQKYAKEILKDLAYRLEYSG